MTKRQAENICKHLNEINKSTGNENEYTAYKVLEDVEMESNWTIAPDTWVSDALELLLLRLEYVYSKEPA